MKKQSLLSVITGTALLMIVVALAQCTSPADEKAQAVSEPATVVDTSTVQPEVDTAVSTTTKAVVAEEASVVAPKTIEATPKALTKTPPKAAPVTKKPQDATKTTQAKSKTETATTPPPAAKEPKVETPTSTPAPKAEPKAELAATPAPKQATVKLSDFTLKSSKAVVKGSSTLHDWESKITKMEGKGSFQTKDNVLVALKDVEIKIDVKGIKSKEGKKMDDKTFETFKSDKHPSIVYTFENAAVKMGASNAVTVEASGKLSMAGTTQSVSLTANGTMLANGDLQLSVSKKIKMTDYKMEPPVMMLGTLKVGNEVTVSFDFVLEKAK